MWPNLTVERRKRVLAFVEDQHRLSIQDKFSEDEEGGEADPDTDASSDRST
jgi:hypothetical protein